MGILFFWTPCIDSIYVANESSTIIMNSFLLLSFYNATFSENEAVKYFIDLTSIDALNLKNSVRISYKNKLNISFILISAFQ